MNNKLGEVTMSFRRLIVSIACVLVAAACSDRPSPLAPPPQLGGPHFLRLPSTALRFEAIGAVAKPGVPDGSFALADPNALSVNTYEASFWAKRGESRTLQINYVSGSSTSTSPFLQFTATDPIYVPGRGALAVGDSVLITVRVDSQTVAAHFEPSGLQFGTPSALTLWYGGIEGDLNGDGVVDGTDATIESQLLGMWSRDDATNTWAPIFSARSATEKWVAADVPHFSEYAISW